MFLKIDYLIIDVIRQHRGSVPSAHVAIDHSHSQQPVPRGFPLFKRCE